MPPVCFLPHTRNASTRVPAWHKILLGLGVSRCFSGPPFLSVCFASLRSDSSRLRIPEDDTARRARHSSSPRIEAIIIEMPSEPLLVLAGDLPGRRVAERDNELGASYRPEPSAHRIAGQNCERVKLDFCRQQKCG